MTASLRIELFPADLDASVDFYVSVLADGGTLAEGLVTRPWGLTDFRVYDPDGNYWRVTDRQCARRGGFAVGA